MAALFDMFAAEIVNGVIVAMVKGQIQGLMRTVFRTQALCWPSLDEARNITSTISIPLSLTEIRDLKSLRRFVSMAHEIHVLAHSCLDYYIQTSMVMSPSSLVQLPHNGSIQDRFDKAESRQYETHYTNAPSWIEEQQVMKALWRIQLFFELNIAQKMGILNWSRDDLQTLASINIRDFYTVKEFELQQILTVYEFIQGFRREGYSQDDDCRLPIVPMENPFNTTCAPQPFYYSFREDIYQQGQRYVHKPPMSWNFQGVMARDPLFSPPPGIPFDPYRKFGFALWDDKRMTDLGLAKPSRRVILDKVSYYFRWRSVLTEEERKWRP
ncbi:hypothetical protein B7463_g12320, partial [Scytalidium lignicola]